MKRVVLYLDPSPFKRSISKFEFDKYSQIISEIIPSSNCLNKNPKKHIRKRFEFELFKYPFTYQNKRKRKKEKESFEKGSKRSPRLHKFLSKSHLYYMISAKAKQEHISIPVLQCLKICGVHCKWWVWR